MPNKNVPEKFVIFFLLALSFSYHVDQILDTTYTILHIIIQQIHITLFVNIFNPIGIVLTKSFYDR